MALASRERQGSDRALSCKEMGESHRHAFSPPFLYDSMSPLHHSPTVTRFKILGQCLNHLPQDFPLAVHLQGLLPSTPVLVKISQPILTNTFSKPCNDHVFLDHSKEMENLTILNLPKISYRVKQEVIALGTNHLPGLERTGYRGRLANGRARDKRQNTKYCTIRRYRQEAPHR